MPDYGQNRDGLTRRAIEYWAQEFRRLRIGEQMGISFETFLCLKRSVRVNLHQWAEDILRDWNDNPRWLTMANSPMVLDWTSDDPPADVAGGEAVTPHIYPN